MSEYESGTVARIAARGTSEVALRSVDGDWRNAVGTIYDDQLTAEPRPLVVIDPENSEEVERLAFLWNVQEHATLGRLPMSLTAYRMQAALREYADPKPPKPEEPTGLGAVVEDIDGNRWVRHSLTTTIRHWRSAVGEGRKRYDEIAVVRVLSEGVSE